MDTSLVLLVICMLTQQMIPQLTTVILMYSSYVFNIN
nr:MAG TPA: hypothetical protein [Bacteriophage sp.]